MLSEKERVMKKKRLLWIIALAAIAVIALVLALTLPGKRARFRPVIC